MSKFVAICSQGIQKLEPKHDRQTHRQTWPNALPRQICRR